MNGLLGGRPIARAEEFGIDVQRDDGAAGEILCNSRMRVSCRLNHAHN